MEFREDHGELTQEKGIKKALIKNAFSKCFRRPEGHKKASTRDIRSLLIAPLTCQGQKSQAIAIFYPFSYPSAVTNQRDKVFVRKE